MPVTPLSGVAEAALKGKLQEVRGPYQLHISVREALVPYLAARGEGLPDLPWAVDVTNEAAWERRWKARLVDAGINSKADEEDFIGWLRAATAASAGSAEAHGSARVALRSLEASGIMVPDAARVDLEKELASSEAGDTLEQCTSRRCAWMLLIGEDAGVEDAIWWDAQHASLGGANGGTINIVSRPSYRSIHKTTNSTFSVLTLERALKEESLFERWLPKMVEKLQNSGLPKAGLRLMQIVAQATTQAGGNWQVKRSYLEGYFFDEYLGLGLPALMASASAFNALGRLVRGMGNGKQAPSSGGSLAGGSTIDLSSFSSGSSTLGPSACASVIGSDLGPSASVVGGSVIGGGSAFDPSTLRDAIVEAMTPVTSRLAALEASISPSGQPPPSLTSGRKCLFCGREVCDMLRGGEPCREAKQAETARNQANAAKRRAAAEAAKKAADAATE